MIAGLIVSWIDIGLKYLKTNKQVASGQNVTYDPLCANHRFIFAPGQPCQKADGIATSL